jgi:hypothetical protein
MDVRKASAMGNAFTVRLTDKSSVTMKAASFANNDGTEGMILLKNPPIIHLGAHFSCLSLHW